MKNLLLIGSLLLCLLGNGQNYTWTKQQSLPHGIYSPAGFTIGDKIYSVCGALVAATTPKTLTNEVWEYNTTTNVWTRKNDFPGDAVYGAGGFAINGYGYVVNGWLSAGNGTGPNTLWQYDPATDSWTQKASFPGSTRYTCATFVMNNKAYVALGFSPYCNDMYEYDPSSNVWSQKASFPGLPRQAPIWFVLGNYAYVGMGPTSGDYQMSDFYRYDPITDSWSQRATFPSDPLQSSYCFELNGEGYVVNGITQDNLNYTIGASNKIWKYNPTSDNWSFMGVFPDTAIFYGICEKVGNAIYMGLGAGDHFNFPTTSMLWRYGPADSNTSCTAIINSYRLSNSYYNFQANGAFSPTATLNWNFGDGSTAQGASVMHIYNGAGTYHVSLQVNDVNGAGCSYSASDSIIVSGLSTCGVSISNTSIMGQNTLYTHTTGFGPYFYEWTCQQDSSFHSTLPDPMVVIAPNSPATYCVKITDTTGCIATACRQLTYIPDTFSCATYLYVFPEGYVPGLYYAYVYHVGATPVSYNWTFGDGQFSTDSLPTHNYAFPNFYYVCLSITDSNNCTSSYCDSFFYAYKMGGGPMKSFKAIERRAAGIQKIGDKGFFEIGPNPASSEIFVRYELNTSDEVLINIFDVNGKIVMQKQQHIIAGKESSEHFETNELARGTYLVTFQTKSQGAYVQKVILH